jgi:hypothetical protein
MLGTENNKRRHCIRDVLDAADGILACCGAADTCICLATAGGLIPDAVRRLPQ